MKTVSSAHVTYHLHPLLTPEEARDLRARALRYAFDRYFEKQKAKTGDGEKGSGER